VDSDDELSTVALLFQHLFPYYRNDKNLFELYMRLIKGLSDWDTGKISTPRKLNRYPLFLPQLISAFNRLGEPSQDQQFIKAVNFSHTVLANEMNTAKEIVFSKEIWSRKKIIHQDAVLLDHYCAFWRTIQDKPKFKYIVQPEAENWSVVSVNSKDYPLPAIVSHNFQKINMSKVVFQHKSKFITVFKELKDALTFVNELKITND
jgi:uncharacterized UPF0160 family protein